MPLVNQSKREINVKIVYTGMSGVGKGTNLSVIHRRLKPEFRGQLRTLPMGDCLMHLCEFLPPGTGAVPGFSLRVHLYTLASADVAAPEWRMVLKGADGIVFVASSDPASGDETRSAFAGMLSQLNSLGLDLAHVPIVVQANRQDLPDPLDPQAVQQLIGVPGVTVLPASAVQGIGVLETVAAVMRKVTAILQKREYPTESAGEETADDSDLDDTADDGDYGDGPEETLTDIRYGLPPSRPGCECNDLHGSPLTIDGAPIDLPLSLTIGGVERHFVLTLTIRETGATQYEPLRGAGYVR